MKLQNLMEESKSIKLSPANQMESFPEDGRYNNHITGNFDCDAIGLTSLQYGPTKVDGFFTCDKNKLTSLKYGPMYVGKDYYVVGFGVKSADTLTSLEGAPSRLDLGGFHCQKNSNLSSLIGVPSYINGILLLDECGFTSLKSIHKLVKYCKRISVGGNPIQSHLLGLLKIEGLAKIIYTDYYTEYKYKHVIEIINKYLKQPMSDERLENCREELIDKGFEEYALE